MRTKALLGSLAMAMFLMSSCSKEGAKESTATTTNVSGGEEVPAYHYVVDDKGVSTLVDKATMVPANPKQWLGGAANGRTQQPAAKMLDIPVGANIGFYVKSRNSNGTFACRVTLYGIDKSFTLYQITDDNIDVFRDINVSGTVNNPDNNPVVIDFNMSMPCGHTYDIAAKTFANGGGSPAITLISRAYWFGYNFLASPGLGDNADGADVKITDINRNGIPDIFLMANDDPPGGNSFRYKFLMDVDANGVPAAVLPEKGRTCNCNDAQGAGAAFGDIDKDGKVDMILMAVDAPAGLNKFRYQIGFGMNANGEPDRWQTYNDVDGIGNDGMDGSVALADINKNGTPDMVFMGVDGISESTGYSVRYKVGFDIRPDGTVTSWGPMKVIRLWQASQIMGAGIDIADLKNNGTLTMTAFYYQLNLGKRYFTCLFADLDQQGNTISDLSTNIPSFSIDPVGEQAQGGGVAIGDIDRDGKKDMIFMANDNPSGPNSFFYYMLFGIRFDWAPGIRFSRASCN